MNSVPEVVVAALTISELYLGFFFSCLEEEYLLTDEELYGPVLLNLRSPTDFLHFIPLCLFPVVPAGSSSVDIVSSLFLPFLRWLIKFMIHTTLISLLDGIFATTSLLFSTGHFLIFCSVVSLRIFEIFAFWFLFP